MIYFVEERATKEDITIFIIHPTCHLICVAEKAIMLAVGNLIVESKARSNNFLRCVCRMC